MNWYKTHMHLHASFEQYASVRSHAEMGRRLGFDALFITEHDLRMNHMPGGIERFALSAPGDALWENGAGWRHPDGTPCAAVADGAGAALLLHSGEEAIFSSPGKRHQASLLADLTLNMAFHLPAGMRLRIDVALSLRPDMTQQHLYYEIGDCPGGEPTAWRVPLAGSGDFTVSLPLSADALRFDEFGQDNAFCSVVLTVFGDGEGLCRGFTTTRKYTAEAVRGQLQALCERVGAAWGLKIHAADEITLPGGHRNSYSAFVPVIDYEKTGYDLSTAQACAYVAALGGTLSQNHPFELWKKQPMTPEERPRRVEELTERLLACRAEGAQLLEVGFPEGRSGFSLADHLRLWDNLAMRGLPLTGYGDSDSHDSRKNWLSGNNFATWLCAASAERADLEEAMRAGRAVMGDPTRWHGAIRFTVGGAGMGQQLAVGAEDAVPIDVELSGLTEPVRCVIISAGKVLYDAALAGETARVRETARRGADAVAPVRVELYGMDGRCLLLTNPVYLCAEEAAG